MEAPLLGAQSSERRDEWDLPAAPQRSSSPLAASATSANRSSDPSFFSRAATSFYVVQDGGGAGGAYGGTDDSGHVIEWEAVANLIRWDAVKSSLRLLPLLPFIGGVFFLVGLLERNRRVLTTNASDWFVLCFVGFCVQMTVVMPIVNLAIPNAHYNLVVELDSNADYIGPFIVFPSMCFYFLSIALAYNFFFARKRIRELERPGDVILALTSAVRKQQMLRSMGTDAPPAAAYNSSDVMEDLHLIKLQIQDETRLPSWICAPVGLSIGFVQMLSLRVCAWTGRTACTTRLSFELEDYHTVYYNMATLYWWLTFTSITTMICFGLLSYYQQLAQIEQFTYMNEDDNAKKGRNGTRMSSATAERDNSYNVYRTGLGTAQRSAAASPTSSPRSDAAGGAYGIPVSPCNNNNNNNRRRYVAKTKDLFSPKNLSLWITVWQELLSDLRDRPPMQAVILVSVTSALICGISTSTYVIFDNLYEGSAVAEFTSGCISVLIFCVFALGGFIFITVRLEYVVEYQIKGISETQTQVQRQLDTEYRQTESTNPNSISAETRQKMLRAKVNVLQGLDTVLRTSESKPKLVGLSLETIRWAVIVLGLFVMNTAFFVLYRTKCS